MDVAERFWAKVEPEPNSGCWLWLGALSGGRGSFRWNGRSERAYRVALILSGVELPPDYHARHKCDFPICVNPSHVLAGTHQDNMDDMIERGRQAVGPRLPQTKLADSDVLYLREIYAAGGVTMATLAERFGISIGHVCGLINLDRKARRPISGATA